MLFGVCFVYLLVLVVGYCGLCTCLGGVCVYRCLSLDCFGLGLMSSFGVGLV